MAIISSLVGSFFNYLIPTPDCSRHFVFQLFETSAKENLNVEEMFQAITELVLRSKKQNKESLVKQQTDAIRVGGGGGKRPGQKSSKKGGCCK